MPRAPKARVAGRAPRDREDPVARRRRARAVLTRLAKANPDWGPTLEFANPFQLLVATILAAQAQDEHINQVTRSLFVKYRGPADYLKVPVEELERDVHATGFFRMKAKAIRGSSEQLLAEYGPQVRVPAGPDQPAGEPTAYDRDGTTTAVVGGMAWTVPPGAHPTGAARRVRPPGPWRGQLPPPAAGVVAFCGPVQFEY